MITIRRFRSEDAHAIALLEEELFSVPYDVPWPEDVVAGYLRPAHRVGWVATEGDEICGYLFASVIMDAGNIDALGVAPARQRQGIGRSLLHEAVRLFSGLGMQTVWLDVAVKNAAALAFYLNTGFEEVSRTPGYYEGPTEMSDAILMRLRLPGSKSLA